jgi:hypothetical protein
MAIATPPEYKTFKLPPSGFKPLEASTEELLRHGFPPRPEDPKLLEHFTKTFTRLERKLEVVKPELKVVEHVVHGPRQNHVIDGVETSNNWSGAVVFASDISIVAGHWTIPAITPPSANQEYWCASWVGIDGDGSNDVCQSGVAAYIENSSLTVYPWIEWYPAPSMAITNIAVAAGDTVSVMVCASGAGATSATVYFSNLTTGRSTSVALTAPRGTTLAANCAEWIVEAPTVNGGLSALADYGQCVFIDSFCSANGTTLDAGTAVNGGRGDTINMTNASGATISNGAIGGSEVVECLYA